MCHCGKKAIAKTLCRNHYNLKWKKDNNKLTPRPEVLCHCGVRQVAKGLCRKHYSEVRRKANPDGVRESHRKYSSSLKGHENRSRRRASLYGAEGHHTSQELLQLRHTQTNCNGCFEIFSQKTPATVDHIVPLVRGGTNNIENIQLLCGPCNSSKGSKTHDEWTASKSRKLSRLASRGGTGEVVEFPKRSGESGA